MPLAMIRSLMNTDAVIRAVSDDSLPAGTARIARGNVGQYMIETAVPDWKDGTYGEEYPLRSCYRTSFALALEYGCETVAVPLLAYPACPGNQAVQIAVEEAEWFLKSHELFIFLVLERHDPFIADSKLFNEVQVYLYKHYAETSFPDYEPPACTSSGITEDSGPGRWDDDSEDFFSAGGAVLDSDLYDLLKATDESFTEALFRLIDERGMTDAQCYRKANVDRKLFSKIRSNIYYRPSKPTVCAFAIALELPLDEAKDLIGKAGYSLTHSSRFDIIVEYFLKKQCYSVTQINEVLFEYDLPLLGSNVA